MGTCSKLYLNYLSANPQIRSFLHCIFATEVNRVRIPFPSAQNS